MSFVAKACLILLAFGVLGWWLRRGEPTKEPLNAPASGDPSKDVGRFRFAEAGDEWGLEFRHDPGRPTFFYPEIMGAGVAVADFDRDGRLDVLLRGARPGKGHPLAKKGPTSALFLQRQRGRFEDASQRSGILDDGYAMGAAVGDVNNDGVPDLYLCNFGVDRLYVGKGDGTFADVTGSSGCTNTGFASSACFLDFDRDGRLDLYVANYVQYPKQVDCVLHGRRDYCNPVLFKGLAHRLYRNATPPGSAPERVRFEDASVASGVGAKLARGLGVILCDANEDGWPDLYVANDEEPNFLWINQKNGIFTESAAADGVAVDGLGEPQGSMGIAEADVDDDGALDLIVTNFRFEYTAVYCRRENGYQDRSGALGIASLTRPFTGFGAAALDVDGDGVDEILQANGRVTQLESKPAVLLPSAEAGAPFEEFWNAYKERGLLMYRNGSRFEDGAAEAGDFGQWVGIGRGLAVGDVDGDGGPDLVALDFADRAKLFLNRARRQGRWISVAAVDPLHGGRDALGARVALVANEKRFTKRIRTCGSYQSASEPRAFFGLGSIRNIDRVEITWPDGSLTPETFPAPDLDRAYTFRRGRGTSVR